MKVEMNVGKRAWKEVKKQVQAAVGKSSGKGKSSGNQKASSSGTPTKTATAGVAKAMLKKPAAVLVKTREQVLRNVSSSARGLH